MANTVIKTDTSSLIAGDHDISALLTPQTEKPNHYTYLKEFRVEQCPAFLQHKCNQHRPFVCFHWHFQNQRRRRPVRRRDGTFNYSADVYCQNYDETTGLCTNGDDCPFLHRTAGDTERRYHLRYYKTCMCVHDTDSRGNCVKNGQHCAFAHGIHDQRPPVYDIKELEAMQNAENAADAANGPNVLDKERSLMNEDPKWQDTNYVLANYKTEPCKRPPRLCRQGYACPQYHNSKDKRRSPRKFKYRSTPCPNVKHGEEWGEPANCDAGDNCQYCHTRTEQQFHPEIYKSTKCNDVQQAGYCPRSVFCAFAHVEQELAQRDIEGPPNPLALSEIISNALPPDLSCSLKKELKPNDFMNLNGNAESSESASTSSLGSNHSSHNKAPGAQLHQQKVANMSQQFQNNHLTNHAANTNNSNLINNMHSYSNNTNNSFNDYNKTDITKQLNYIDNDPSLTPLEKEQRKRMCLNFNLGYTGGVHNSLDEFGRRDSLHLDNSMSAGILQNSSAPINVPGSPMGLLQGPTAPVNIPGSQLNSFSPSNHANLFGVQDPFGNPGSLGGGSAPKISNSYSQGDNLLFQSHLISPHGFDGLSMSPDLGRISELNAINSELSNAVPGQNSLFDNHLQSSAPGSKPHGSYSMSPLVTGGLSEITRLREELQTKNVQLNKLEEQTAGWQKEVEDRNHKIQLTEQQRDEALSQIKQLKEKVEQLNLAGTNFRTNELRGMPLHKLKTLQAKLRSELEEVDNVLYVETASKCMICEENPRSVTLVPCNHYALCDTCAVTQRECPYCQTPVTSQA